MSEEKTTTQRERTDEASDHEQHRHRIEEEYNEERNQSEENIRIKESLSKRILSEVSSTRPLIIKMERERERERERKGKLHQTQKNN
jgi:hypothetical protein